MVIGSTWKFKNLKETSYCIKALERRFPIQSECLLTNTLVNGQLWGLAFKAGTQACEERREEHAQWDERRQPRRLRIAEGSISKYRGKHGIDLLVSAQS